MKKLIIIIAAITLLSCTKECPIPDPDPVTYKITYIVSGSRFWWKHFNPVTESTVTSDTVSGTYSVSYTVDNWETLTLLALPDSHSYASTTIIINGEICHESSIEREIPIVSSLSMCNK